MDQGTTGTPSLRLRALMSRWPIVSATKPLTSSRLRAEEALQSGTVDRKRTVGNEVFISIRCERAGFTLLPIVFDNTVMD